MKYKKIDLIRISACIIVLLYHLNILESGYLAVNVFFTLSGYLALLSAYKKEFSIKEYYKNRLKKLYLPLVIVTFITIFITSFIPNLYWYNLKEEVTSILLGYNNFFEISININYFLNQTSTPFIHFWYIAILLQFDLIFPFIVIILKKIKEKYSKLPIIIMTFITSLLILYFYISCFKLDITTLYYSTFTRIYAIILGLTLALIHIEYKPITMPIFKNKIFYFYLFILFNLFINNDLNLINMIITSLITCRLISYSIEESKENKIISFISSISYEIYLVQCPVIFILNHLNMPNKILIILVILLVSYIIHTYLNTKNKIYKAILSIIIIPLVLIGMYQYITVKSYQKEIKALENELEQNEINIKENEENYKEKLKQEQESWSKTLQELDNDYNKLEDIVTNLPLIGIGDSVMLGATTNLQKKFPNSYYDARVSRTAWEASAILDNLKNNNLLSNTIVINLGTNGDCTKECKQEIMLKLEGKKVFWVNTVNYPQVNEELLSFKEDYDNLTIIDWYNASFNHKEYFIYDGIHLTSEGKEAFTNLIYEEIYQSYLKDYQKKKEEIVNKYEENLKSKFTFYGNDMLLKIYPYLQDFKDSNFIINNNYEELKESITNSIDNNSLNYNIVLAFDSTIDMDIKEYNNILSLCDNNKVYIITTKKLNIEKESLEMIDLSEEINDYVTVDGIHLSDEGSIKLSKKIIEKMIK